MAEQPKEYELHLTTEELAARWHMAKGTLSNWRNAGDGPAYIKLGKRILYPMSAVIDFERRNTVR